MIGFALQYILPALALAGGVVAVIYLPPPFNKYAVLGLFGLALASGLIGVGRQWGDAECKKKLAALQAQVEIEHTRRASVLARLRDDAQARADALDEKERELARLKEESAHASQSHNGKPCLDADGVLRLNRLRRK